MVRITCIAWILLLIAGCSHRQPGKDSVLRTPRSSLQIIDHPAAVIIAPGSSKTLTPGKSSPPSLEKILSPLHIPVVHPQSGNLEFVKSNGDRVRLNIGKLKPTYDLILFNAVNDPIPCYLKDIRKVMRKVFPQPEAVNATNEQSGNSETAMLLPEDSARRPIRDLISFLQSRNRPPVIVVEDTAALPLALKNMTGIRYVENRLDKRAYFSLHFENDLITYPNSDRYFTNGVTLSLQSPKLKSLAASALMIPYRHTSYVSYSLHLVQNMYTPTDTRIAPALHDDRPYSSYLYLGYRKTTLDPFRRIKLSTEADLGYIGPYSPGGYMQTIVHKTFPTNDKPQGWDTQIKTDAIINYSVDAEKALLNGEHLVVSATGSLKAGTLYNQAGAGIALYAGKMDPHFGASSPASSWQYFVYLNTNVRYVVYDATLQGGLFSRDNIFTLRADEVSHSVGDAELGLQLRYKGTGIELAQHFLSPEYKKGLWHKWGRISLIFKL